jgi:acetyl-CoA carboxylase biotin carboxyl carrier protein
LSHDNLTYEDLLQIVELIKASEQYSEFRLKVGEIEIELRRRRSATAAAPDAANGAPASGSAAASTAQQAPHAAAQAPAPGPSTKASPRVAAARPAGSIVVRAPMVGTFYRSPAPGAPPFVEVGQPVDEHTTVCIIEVMKLMNSIPAGAKGVVTHVLVDDGAPVATGAELIVLDPR